MSPAKKRECVDVSATARSSLSADTAPGWIKTSRSNTTLIDLAGADFVDPAGLVSIAAAAERAVQDGREVAFVAPRNKNCANYLSRMHLAQVLHDLGVETGLRRVRERNLTDQLCELRRFDDETGIEVVASTVMQLFRDVRGGEWAPDLYDPLFEIGVNVVQHSGQRGGYLALQTFPRRSEVAFAVADCGRGLLASLTDDEGPNETVPNDPAALRLAATKHVSSSGAPGRGSGINGVVDLVGKHAGAVMLQSGHALGWFERGHTDPRVIDSEVEVRGTLAYARLSL